MTHCEPVSPLESRALSVNVWSSWGLSLQLPPPHPPSYSLPHALGSNLPVFSQTLEVPWSCQPQGFSFCLVPFPWLLTHLRLIL